MINKIDIFNYNFALAIEENRKSLSDILINYCKFSKIILIKVNWSNDRPGYFTELETLRFVVDSLRLQNKDKKIILLESYSYERNDPELIYYQKKQHKRKHIIRQNEIHYLNRLGFKSYLEENKIRYINLTEEMWAGRVLRKKVVQDYLGKKKIVNKEFLKMVPQVLQDYIGCPLISLTKIKGYIKPDFNFFSLSLKNQFGLLPIPCRRKYHGKGTKGLPSAIIDMNVIYSSMFKMIGFCEGIYKTRFMSNKVKIIENSGFACISDDLVTLDAAIINSLGFNPFCHHFILQAEQRLNRVDKEQLFLKSLTSTIGNEIKNI